MRNYILVVILPVLLLSNGLKAETVVISGADSNFAGEVIRFYRYADKISMTEELLAGDTVSEKGVFELSFDIESVSFVFANLGAYQAYLYAEPGKEYNIILPPKKEKTQADLLNPYFEPILLHLGFDNTDEKDLNVQIRMFEDAYQPYYDKHLINSVKEKDFSTLDKDIVSMDKPFSKSKNTFFNAYRRYKYGMLKYLAFRQRTKSISDEYFKNQPLLLQNPAYMELFNLLYDNYFMHFARTEEGKKIAQHLGAKASLSGLQQALSTDSVLQPDALRDLVILKNLHDQFYDDNYSRSAMLKLLDSLKYNTDKRLAMHAENIRAKTTRLLVGFEPPQFELADTSGQLRSLETFKGKFVYLNFCSCFSYTCLNEFTMLQQLHNKHNKYLTIVTVIVGDEFESMKSFIERSGYNWTFLHYGNYPDIIKEYDLRAFPTYYLIDHEGKLAMSPAASPREQFEGRLFKELRAKGIL